MLIETTLVAHDDSRRESVSYDIPDDDWQRLVEFLDHVEGLRATSFVRDMRGGSINLQWKPGESLRATGTHVVEEPVWAMLHKLRPFVFKNEPYYLPLILKTMKRRLGHVAFHRELDSLRDGFSLKSMVERLPLRGDGRPLLSQSVVMDWLNSFEYHRDAGKRAAVLRDLGALAHAQNGMSLILFALVDMVQAVLDSGTLVRTLQRCSEGNMLEVRCPSEYFDDRRMV